MTLNCLYRTLSAWKMQQHLPLQSVRGIINCIKTGKLFPQNNNFICSQLLTKDTSQLSSQNSWAPVALLRWYCAPRPRTKVLMRLLSPTSTVTMGARDPFPIPFTLLSMSRVGVVYLRFLCCRSYTQTAHQRGLRRPRRLVQLQRGH